MIRTRSRKRFLCSLALLVAVGVIAHAAKAGEAAAGPSGRLTQAAAVELYNRYREALVDGDYNAFLENAYTPGKPEGLAQIPAEQTPKEFVAMKGFLLELNPELANAKILRFAADNKAAILVTRVDIENQQYVTLRALLFAADRDGWKVMPKVHDDTFPMPATSEVEQAIQDALNDNPELQLGAAVAQAEAMQAAAATPAPQPAGPASAGDGRKPSATAPKPVETVTVAPAQAISQAFNDTPEHQAIVKALTAAGERLVLQSATSVAMLKDKDFANANISYTREGESTDVELFLFKEDGAWVAYLELPAHKDHPAVFTTLARRYCQPRYRQLQSVSLIDDGSRRGKTRDTRSVNLVCSELIDNQWQDHRLTLVYQYDGKQGWHITDGAEQKEAPASPPPKAAQPKHGAKPAWQNAKAEIDKILRHIGGSAQPVFVVFGIDGNGFIQFHYVTEPGSKDIRTVDWQNGKIKAQQPSRLAKPCPAIPLEEVDFDQVTKIFDDVRNKAKPGDRINVNLGSRFADGCQEPVWQGIATSAKHALTVTYSLDGRQTDITDYSF